MESLTHVSMWSKHGWIRISPNQAIKQHPYGVIVRSDSFRCELCGQSVGLSAGKRQYKSGGKGEPYFFHSLGEADKSCPERTHGNPMPLSYKASEYSLPLRLLILRDAFRFEIGFPGLRGEIPDSISSFDVCIRLEDKDAQPFRYQYPARFESIGFTWLSVGNIPSSSYTITTTYENPSLSFYWPFHVRGVDRTGTVFDAETGNMLSHGADVQIGKAYFVLLSGTLTYIPTSVQYQEIAKTRINLKEWRLYKITALNFSESSAKFFMNYQCRLTEMPASIRVLWPAYVENPYIIRHNQERLWLYVRGENVETKSFPPTHQTKFPSPSNLGNVHVFHACERQQILSIGRSEMIQYAYLWQDALDENRKLPSVSVQDLAGETIPSGIAYQIPRRNILQICSQNCDGTVSILQHGILIGRRLLKAGERIDISSVCFGMEIRITLGLDCVWTVQFQRRHENHRQLDSELVRRLERGRGALRPVPHSWGAMANKLEAYPNVREWLYKKVREGVMSESSYCLLRHIICGGDSEKENP